MLLLQERKMVDTIKPFCFRGLTYLGQNSHMYSTRKSIRVRGLYRFFFQVEVIQSAIKYIQETKALWENLLAGNGAEELSKLSLCSCISKNLYF